MKYLMLWQFKVGRDYSDSWLEQTGWQDGEGLPGGAWGSSSHCQQAGRDKAGVHLHSPLHSVWDFSGKLPRHSFVDSPEVCFLSILNPIKQTSIGDSPLQDSHPFSGPKLNLFPWLPLDSFLSEFLHGRPEKSVAIVHKARFPEGCSQNSIKPLWSFISI